jgi:hypothetical protein
MKSREVCLVGCYTDSFGLNSAQNRGADRGPQAGSPLGVVVAPGPIVQHSGLAMGVEKNFLGIVLTFA